MVKYRCCYSNTLAGSNNNLGGGENNEEWMIIEEVSCPHHQTIANKRQ